MAFIRKKTVEMDGVSIVIAPLLSGEIDEFLLKQQEILTNGHGDEDARFKTLRQTWLEFITKGLNQADPTAAFTVARLQAEFDKVFLEKLRLEIMQMSGIGAVGEVKAP